MVTDELKAYFSEHNIKQVDINWLLTGEGSMLKTRLYESDEQEKVLDLVRIKKRGCRIMATSQKHYEDGTQGVEIVCVSPFRGRCCGRLPAHILCTNIRSAVLSSTEIYLPVDSFARSTACSFASPNEVFVSRWLPNRSTPPTFFTIRHWSRGTAKSSSPFAIVCRFDTDTNSGG